MFKFFNAKVGIRRIGSDLHRMFTYSTEKYR